MTNPQLEVRNLTKSYDEGRIEALRGVDLTITAGEGFHRAPPIPTAFANPTLSMM